MNTLLPSSNWLVHRYVGGLYRVDPLAAIDGSIQRSYVSCGSRNVRRHEQGDGVLATRGGAVEHRKKGTGCAVTQAPGRVQCCEAWRSGRRGQRRERPLVHSGGHFCVIGSSLGCCCCLPEVRHAVVRRPPRQRHRDRLHYGVGRDLHYRVGRDLHYRVGRYLHYGVGRDLHYGTYTTVWGGTYTTVWGGTFTTVWGGTYTTVPTLRCGAGPTLWCGSVLLILNIF